MSLPIVKRLLLLGALVGAGGGLAGCSADPFAPLIEVGERPATVLPSQAPERTADGFANILADPATVAGLPRTPHEVKADKAAVQAEGAHLEAAAAGLDTGSHAAALAARGRSHVAAAEATIAASGRPTNGTFNSIALPQPAAPARADPRANPGEPVDPDAPVPRAVGVPAFLGDGVAAPQRGN